MAELVIKLVNGELAGKTAQEIAKNVREASLALSKAKIGTEEWAKAHEKLDTAKKLQVDLKNQIESTSKASATLKSTFGGILNQIPGFSQISGALSAAKGGVGGLTSGFGLLRGAIIATGIGALVIAVMAVVGWFTKTEKGANMVSGAFKGIGAVIDTLMGKLWNIGDTLKQLFSNPLKFFADLGKDIHDAAIEGYDLVQVFDDIEDKQRDLSVRSKEQEIAIDKLLLNAKNVGKTYQEKLDILAQADKATRASYAEQLALSKEYLEAVNREVAAEEKQKGEVGDDLADKQAQAKLAYLDLLGQETQMEDKIANFRDKIFDKQEKQQDKLNDNKAKQLEKDKKEQEEALRQLEDLRVEAIRDSEAQEIAATELKFQRQLEDLTLQGAERLEAEKLIEEVRGQEIQAIKDKYATDAATKKKAADDLATEQSKKAAEDQARVEADKAAFAIQMDMQRLENAQMVVGGLGDLLVQNIKNEKDAKAIKKSLGLIDIGINLTKELSANALAASLNPLNGPTFGIAGATQLAVSNTGSIIRAGIAAAKIALFRKGGVLKGPSHEQGGILMPEAEGDEIVLTKNVYRNPALRRMASDINVAAGGRKFAAGGPINPLDRGRGPISRTADLSSNGFPFDLKPLAQMIDASTDAKIRNIKVINVVSETESGIQTLNQIRDEANV